MTSALPGGPSSDIWQRARQRVGTTINGKYRIDDVIGVGGMAFVYRATHRNQAEFAIKMLLPELSYREDIRTRFLREGYAANSVKHDGVVRVVDDDTAEDGAAFLVMDLLHGKGVEALWSDHNRELPISAAAAIIDQLLDVLEAAHGKGIVHRDIKPANLFVTTDGTLKVLDFGIARVRDAMASDAEGGTNTGMLLGTPAFMAPEQAKAQSSLIDGQTDLWAVGATLFTLATGKFVHEGDNGAQLLIAAATIPARSVATIAPRIPTAIASVVDKALAFDKASRWRTASEMRSALRDAHQASFGTSVARDAVRGALSGPSATTPQSIATAQTVELAPLAAAQSHILADSTDVAKERQASAIVSNLEQAHIAAQVVAGMGTGSTTAQPISSRAPSPPVTRSRIPLPLRVLAVVGLGAGVLVVLHPWRATPSSTGPSATTAAPEPSTGAPTPTTSVTIDPLVITPPQNSSVTEHPVDPTHHASVVASATEHPLASASASHAAATATHVPSATPTHAGSASTTPQATRPSASCDPPFYFDAANHKIFKKECVK